MENNLLEKLRKKNSKNRKKLRKILRKNIKKMEIWKNGEICGKNRKKMEKIQLSLNDENGKTKLSFGLNDW